MCVCEMQSTRGYAHGRIRRGIRREDTASAKGIASSLPLLALARRYQSYVLPTWSFAPQLLNGNETVPKKEKEKEKMRLKKLGHGSQFFRNRARWRQKLKLPCLGLQIQEARGGEGSSIAGAGCPAPPTKSWVLQ